MVLAGIGPMGTGMEETYQVTSALKHLPFGKRVALLTDARFSGVSTGACIGHIGPEGLAGGPIGKLLDGDIIRVVIDRNKNEGSIDLVGRRGADGLQFRRSRANFFATPIAKRSRTEFSVARRHPALGGVAIGRRRCLERMRLRCRENRARSQNVIVKPKRLRPSKPKVSVKQGWPYQTYTPKHAPK